MKLLDLVVAREALQRLAALELPAPIAFKVARVVRPLSAELQAYEEQRVRLVQKFGEQQGSQAVVLPNRMAEFSTEHQELLDVEINVEVARLSPGILGELVITPGDLLALWFLFEEEDDE